jgi:hypothetical protein
LTLLLRLMVSSAGKHQLQVKKDFTPDVDEPYPLNRRDI